MKGRLKRLTRRTQAIYLETGSLRAPISYLRHAFRAKASLLARHAWALQGSLLPWRLAAERRRLSAHRNQGRLVIAVTAAGGLGDLIIIARCLRDLAQEAEAFAFDVFAASPDLAQWVFAAVPGFGRAYPDTLERFSTRNYDLHLLINQTATVAPETIAWDRLRQAPRMLQAVRRLMRLSRQASLEPYILHHPRLDNGLARKAVYAGKSRQDFLHWMLGIDYGGENLGIEADEEALRRFGLAGRDFITVHNGFDPNFIVPERRATKCYPHFDAVVAGLKATRPEMLIVQLGTTTSEAIAGADLNLIGRTSLAEAAALLRATALHLDNEGGLVHLAACYGRRSLVVFGPTPSDYFGYASNINVDPLYCGGCWWIEESWMNRCPRSMPQPECMFAQPPERVVALALKALGNPQPIQCHPVQE
ncbi:MAG: hypothetical protein INF65_08785 [Roseomonas sp.]|nr:hypothetical protein [Roseomonas sp.]MCA3393190.1 hypothetical protein [Roseomonas sp.]MCA3408042.1 hypothetical protein [Roseomonas sp.]